MKLVIHDEKVKLMAINFELANQILSKQLPLDLVTYGEEFPSNAIKAYLPIYLEYLKNDLSLLGFGPWIVLERTSNSIIGEAMIKIKSESENACELGYRIFSQYRNRGYATATVNLLMEWLHTSSMKKVTATSQKKNIASQKVLIKNEFQPVSEDREFVIFKRLIY